MRDVEKFASSNPYVSANLLAFRAARPALPAWVMIHTDMGWSKAARTVQFCAIGSDHLGLVRPPFAKQVAEVIKRALS